MSLLLRSLRSSSSLHHLTTPFASTIYRLLSTAATTQEPPPNPHFSTVDYLIQSCGLPSDGAIRASKIIQHLKSPDKPDAVLHFLRQTGISESDIRTALSRDPRLLCSHVERNLRPNVAKLQEIGLSIEDISGLISRSPNLFRLNIVPKIDFWMRALGSTENVSVLLRRGPSLLHCNLEKVIVPNLSVLQKQCGLSVRQIVQLINSSYRLIASRPEAMKIKVQRAQELGVSCSSQKFVYALITVGSLKESTLNSKVLYLKSMGLSQEEVNYVIGKAPMLFKTSEELLGHKMKFLKSMGLSKEEVTYMICKAPSVLQITEELLGRKMELLKCMGLLQEEVTYMMSKAPRLLQLSEELLGRKMEFLMKEAGCSKIDVVRNPVLLSMSLEKRLIPRNLVRKLLKSKELPVANLAFASFAKSTEEQFVKKFVLPYQHAFPGLLQAYADVCAGKTAGTEWFKSISS